MSAKREQLVDTALRLFYRDGYHATGIDKIIQEAGVARGTLYKHFKSKDDLILAVLRRRDEEFRAWFKTYVERAASAPQEKLLALFDGLAEWFDGKAFPGRAFHGCSFINASAEYSRLNDPIHRAAAEHKELMFEYTRDLATAAGYEEPDELARELLLLKEGAIVTAQVTGDFGAAARAKNIAKTLLENTPKAASH